VPRPPSSQGYPPMPLWYPFDTYTITRC
jgi:hypothetical protein